MSKELDDLSSEVDKVGALEAQALAAIQEENKQIADLTAKLAAAGSDPAAVTAITEKLQARSASLDALLNPPAPPAPPAIAAASAEPSTGAAPPAGSAAPANP